AEDAAVCGESPAFFSRPSRQIIHPLTLSVTACLCIFAADSPPGPPAGGADVSLKLRISLGLKPLDVGPSETKEQEAEKRYEEHRRKQAQEAKAADVRERIEKARNQQKLREKLGGSGLGEADDADDALLDPRKWVSRQRKRAADKEKDIAAKRALELEEQDRQAAEAAAASANRAKYTSEDLAGIRIGHDFSEFAEGEEKILTLKDTSVLDDGAPKDVFFVLLLPLSRGDELVSAQISEAARARKNVENKRGRKAYTAYDDDEFTEMGAPNKRTILSQYDEEEERAGFVLGGQGLRTTRPVGRPASVDAGLVEEKLQSQSLAYNCEHFPVWRSDVSPLFGKHNQVVTMPSGSTIFFLLFRDAAVPQPQTDYYTAEEMMATFKKPKQCPVVEERQVLFLRKYAEEKEEDEFAREPSAAQDADSMEVGPTAHAMTPRKIAEDQSFVDDDDLQAALARSRRLKSKKLAKSSVEDVARAVLEAASAEQGKEAEGEDEDDDKRIVLSDATEFVRTLSSQPILMRTEASKVPEKQTATGDDMRWRQQNPEEEAEVVMGDADMEDAEEADGAINNDQGSKKEENIKPIEEEPLVSAGLAATLALLKQKGTRCKLEKKISLMMKLPICHRSGFVRDVTAQQDDERAKISYERAKWLAEFKQRDRELDAERRREKEHDRELERTRVEEKRRGYSGGLDEWEREARDRDRERQNEYRERQWAREIQDRFVNYKPDINLDHFDDQGNILNEKEPGAGRAAAGKVPLKLHPPSPFAGFHGKHSGKMKTEKRMQKLAEKKKLEAMASNDTPLHLASTLLEQQKAAGTAHVVLT
ncbi:MAG: SART-1 protein, partial [Olpidium bornovanus]